MSAKSKSGVIFECIVVEVDDEAITTHNTDLTDGYAEMEITTFLRRNFEDRQIEEGDIFYWVLVANDDTGQSIINEFIFAHDRLVFCGHSILAKPRMP